MLSIGEVNKRGYEGKRAYFLVKILTRLLCFMERIIVLVILLCPGFVSIVNLLIKGKACERQPWEGTS